MKEAFNAQKYNKTIKKTKNIMYGGVMEPIERGKYNQLEAEKNTYEKNLEDLNQNLETALEIYKIYNNKKGQSMNMYTIAKWLSANISKMEEMKAMEELNNLKNMVNKYNKLNIDSNIYNQVLPKFKELYYKKSWFS